MTAVADNYTGHVETQTAARRTLPGVSIIKMSVGPMDNNVYLVTCAETGVSLLIDAANDPDLLVDLVREQAPKLTMIITTHQHFDHWQALEAVAEATGAPTAAHPLDAEALPVKPSHLLSGGDSLTVGELTFDVIHLRGHTPGSVALALRPAGERTAVQLFTGDCLFPGGPGRTTTPEEFDSLMTGLETDVFGIYGDDTVVYPGHGDAPSRGARRSGLLNRPRLERPHTWPAGCR